MRPAQYAVRRTAKPDGNGFYLVHLRQNDGLKDLIDLRLTVPDKQMGQTICERWKRNPQTVYLGLLSLLTGEPALVPEHPSSFDQPDFPDEGKKSCGSSGFTG